MMDFRLAPSLQVAGILSILAPFLSQSAFSQQRIINPDLVAGGGLGRIALDGDTLVLGDTGWNPHADPPFQSDGRVYVFRWVAGSWIPSATLTSPLPSAYFGWSLSLRNDLLAVTHLPTTNALSVPLLLFSRNKGGPNHWGLVKSILPEEGAVGFTGASLGEASMAATLKVGSECLISILARNQGGEENWGEVTRVNPYPGSFSSCTKARIRLDADTLALGYGDSDDPGEVRIFERDYGGPHNWGLVQVLPAPAGALVFGAHLDLEGHTLSVTSRVPSNGLLSVYDRSAIGGLDSWSSVAQITDPSPGPFVPSRPTAIAGDTIFLGDTNRAPVVCESRGEGGVSLFQRDLGGPNSWGLLQATPHPEPGTACQVPFFPHDSEFGYAVAADGDSWATLDPWFAVEVSGTLRAVSAAWAYGQPGSLQVLDVHPDLIVNGAVTTNQELLATRGVPRGSASADGATRLLLRAIAPTSGSVEFAVVGPTAENGGVDVVGGAQRLQSVTVPVVSTQQGLRAFASFRVPDEFNRGTDDAALSRDIVVQAIITPASGAQISSSFSIRLVRPPLVLVHGLWSNSNTWTSPLSTVLRIPVIERADYRGANAAHFSENISAVQRSISKALARARLSGIASTQVVVAAHSMGGILTRLWANDPSFARSENFGLGEIRKVISLDTPHFGSPLADFLIELRSRPVSGAILSGLLDRMDHSIVDGAIDDLRSGGPAILGQGACSIPAHSLVGTGGSDSLATIPGSIGVFYTLVNFFENVSGSELFQALQHDAIVPRNSQEGGIDIDATTVIPGLEGIHTVNTGSLLYSDRILELIDTPTSGSEFGLLPAPTLTTRAAPRDASSLTPLRRTPSDVIIVSPSPGTIVSPGEEVVVQVVPGPGAVVDRVLLLGQGLAQVDEGAPFEFTITIPDEGIGVTSLVAVGANAAGNYSQSAEVEVTIQVDSQLVSISIAPEFPLLLWSHDSAQLSVLGLYSDGATREISSSQVGTQYASENPGIASVSPGGLVAGLNLGVATISVQNGVISKEVRVDVTNAWSPIFADGFDAGSTISWSGTSP